MNGSVTYLDCRTVRGEFRGRDRGGEFTNRLALTYRVARPESSTDGPFTADLDFSVGPEEDTYLTPAERREIEAREYEGREACRAATEEALRGLISRYAGRHGLELVAFRALDGGSA